MSVHRGAASKAIGHGAWTRAAIHAQLAIAEQLAVANALTALGHDLEDNDPTAEHTNTTITLRRNALKAIVREGLGI